VNKIALITGASSGIGAGIAQCFMKNGYFVVIADVQSPSFSEEFENLFHYIKCDISKKADREFTVSQIIQKYKRINLLINNAGVAPRERLDILSTTEESYDFVMNINLKGPFFLSQMIANAMIEFKKENNVETEYLPSIINISSISAYTSSTSRGEYCISKAGVSMVTKLFADRLADYDIPVYEIQPGIIQTPMTLSVKGKYDKLIGEGLLPIKRWGLPEDIAQACLTLAQRKIPYTTGEVLHIDGGFHIRRL
jgi:3-oxoacyl-[acyl-carrier protein] reductase